MNDLLNNNTNPKNIEELYYKILKIITEIYEKIITQSVKNRKNKDKAKMKDTEIISTQLPIECLGKTQNAGYLYLCSNHPNLANYVERPRFNRLVISLFTAIKEIRKNIPNWLKEDNQYGSEIQAVALSLANEKEIYQWIN